MTSPSIPKRYESRSLLGEGGSGRVYRVQDSIRDRELALKLVTPAESAFLRREFDTLRQIRHENLIQVFDWGALPSGEAYYTMELIEGGDWARRMGEPQSADEVRRVLTGLLRGLAHLHCHGEIHGDLKPGNILLGAGGVVKITDAGMGGSGGAASGQSGTPGYAAPEVWEGEPADIRSDLYSVGVMAYEALTGKHPFAGHTVREVISGQLEGWVPSPGAHGVRVPADLERVVMRALERQPGLRQGSADEFMEGFGVEDRIGEILGGRLVGREKEIAEIERLLYSEEPGTPTLLYVTGEPGIGKSTLLHEISHRLLSSGGLAVALDFSNKLSIDEQLVESLELSRKGGKLHAIPELTIDLATLLWEYGQGSPLLVHTSLRSLVDAASEQVCRSLARYVWALSVEGGRASRVLIALGDSSRGSSEDPFERTIQLPPFTGVVFDEALKQTLGTANLQGELIAKLKGLTGGNPGALRFAVASLIDQKLLDRRDGVWKFREVAQIHSLEIEPKSNPWFLAWRHLDSDEERALVAISLLRRVNSSQQLREFGIVRRAEDLLPSLEAKGWLRRSHGVWSLASDGIRQVALSPTTEEVQLEAANCILESRHGSGDSDELAGLELRYRPSLASLYRGLESAESALQRGEHRAAIESFALCLDLAARSHLLSRARSICLRLAYILHQVGDDERATKCLKADELWGDGTAALDDAASRHHLLGQIALSKGELDSARAHLTRSIDLTGSTKNSSLLLQCHADLAEIDWRHGGEASRSRAIDRVRTVLSQYSDDPSLRNERAALMYELGAAMVVAGASRESIETLRAGFELAESEYWKMRIANAMSSAFQYLGDPDGEREWLDQAWRFAESSRSDSFKARILSNRGSWLFHQGQFAEAADQNRLSSKWARRFGSSFEYIAGRAGSGMCSIHLARYEDALADAREVMRASQALKDLTYVGKAFEIEGLANYFLGRGDLAEEGVRKALALLSEHGYTVVRPRLGWLLAKVLRRRDEVEESDRLLREAEIELLETRDPEDLWGVQIEMHLARSRNGNAASSVAEIETLFRDSEQRGLLVIVVPAALAISEILHEQRLDHTKFRDLLTVGLERAERSGMRELAWQLSYRMGALAARVGLRKESRSRFTLASRLLHQIVSELGDEHRKSYLRAAHVVSAIKDMDTLS